MPTGAQSHEYARMIIEPGTTERFLVDQREADAIDTFSDAMYSNISRIFSQLPTQGVAKMSVGQVRSSRDIAMEILAIVRRLEVDLPRVGTAPAKKQGVSKFVAGLGDK